MWTAAKKAQRLTCALKAQAMPTSGTTRNKGDEMTLTQIKGMLRFHKSAYKAFKARNQTDNAKQARSHMITMYLMLRATRGV